MAETPTANVHIVAITCDECLKVGISSLEAVRSQTKFATTAMKYIFFFLLSPQLLSQIIFFLKLFLHLLLRKPARTCGAVRISQMSLISYIE